jgi:xylose isomerase
MLRVIDKLDGDNGLGAAIARQDAVTTQAILRAAMFGG